ncbi:MAG: M24 family metallopeptidase [Bacteroidota bacterium]
MKIILVASILFAMAIDTHAQNSTTKPMTEQQTKEKLNIAQNKTRELFKEVEKRGLIIAGKSESQLTSEIVKIADEKFGMKEHWHKKIVRAGVNTVESYSKSPADRVIQKDDIVILDFGPNFEGWETDLGRTYVLGSDPDKLKIKKDVETAWHEAKAWYDKQDKLTGVEFWNYLTALAKRYGYEFGGEIGGHIIGHFPHEQPDVKGALDLDVHPDNLVSILSLDKNGQRRQWLLEMHFVDRAKGIGAFYEDLLN